MPGRGVAARSAALVLSLVFFLALAPGRADAQGCMGAQSFRVHPHQAAARVMIGQDHRGFGLSLGGGRTTAAVRGAFAEVGLTRIEPEQLVDAATSGARIGPGNAVIARLGWQVPLKGHPRLMVCPLVAGGYTSGPEVEWRDVGGAGGEGELDPTTVEATVGGWIGGAVPSSGAVRLLPAVGLQAGYVRTTVETEGVIPPGGLSVPAGQHAWVPRERRGGFAVLSLATGLALGERWLVRPRLELPLGRGGGMTALHLDVASSFGGATSRTVGGR